MKKLVAVMLISFLTATMTPAIAEAAEAIMPIKSRIVRCVTNEERMQMCSQQNLCCNLPMTSNVAYKGPEKHDAPNQTYRTAQGSTLSVE
jgi:hypothetical protein